MPTNLSDLRGLDTGRFAELSAADLAGQCGMQARNNLDPEYSQFMFAVSDRLSTLQARCEQLEAALGDIVKNTSVGRPGSCSTRSKYGSYPARFYHAARALHDSTAEAVDGLRA